MKTYQMNFRSFSKGDFFALSIFPTMFSCLRSYSRKGDTCVCLTGIGIYEAREYSLRLMGSLQILALVRSLLCHIP